MKIAYLSNRFPSAVEPYVVDEIRELRNRGAKVVACSILQPQRRSGTDGSTAVNKVLYMRPMRITQIFGATWLCIRGLWKLRDLLARVIVGNESLNRKVRATAHTWLGAYLAILLRERNVDHIHVHHGYYGSWVAMVAARLLGIRFSMTLHGSDVLLHGAYLDLKLANCAFCITISEFNRRYILDHCREASPEKILVQRIGVACPQVSGGQPRHREAGSPLNLLAVGRLHPVKDHAFLIRACRQLKDRGMNFTCAIAGDGAERNSLLRLIRELNLVHEVRLLGHVAHEDVESLYEQTDVVVLTSRSEGIPLVLMEAMAHGKPVLAPNITGIPELITDGETGFLYAAGSIDNFVQRLEMIRDTYSGLGPLCRAARQKVLEDFDRGKNLAAFCDCLLGRINHSEKEQGREDPLLQQI